METWNGSAAICVNEHLQLLMVKQGKPDERKCWTVPSGGREAGETDEACCIREVFEETGYQVKIVRPLHEKNGHSFGIPVCVKYFEAEIIGGTPTLHDPDGRIYEIAWKSAADIESLTLSFPEDRLFLIDFLNNYGRHEK
ncbi:NUDIX hydrolase [Camelliibacillus cellulosilyticus]|uniref:NUDIX hydrolase n=1 Tax=Camelliibacillus cellulosilyticus TaxID=2174486 RepID=A0ABV9GRF1_9BACL